VMQLHLEAWSHLEKREDRSAFLSAWTGIELSCVEAWKHWLVRQNVSTAQLKRLLRWDINRILEMLQINEVLSINKVNELNSIREQRNGILHRGEAAKELHSKEAGKMLSELLSSIWRLPISRHVWR